MIRLLRAKLMNFLQYVHMRLPDKEFFCLPLHSSIACQLRIMVNNEVCEGQFRNHSYLIITLHFNLYTCLRSMGLGL